MSVNRRQIALGGWSPAAEASDGRHYKAMAGWWDPRWGLIYYLVQRTMYLIDKTRELSFSRKTQIATLRDKTWGLMLSRKAQVATLQDRTREVGLF